MRENVADQADLRHRQHRHRRAALGLRARRAVRRPGRAGGVRQRSAASSLVTAHRRENWGDGLRGHRRGRRAARRRPHPDVALRAPAAPEPARARRVCGRSLRAVANVLLTEPLSYAEFARLLARCHARDHRLGRHPGGGAGARQARARRARDAPSASRASRPARCALVGTDPDRIVAAAQRLLDRPDGLRARWRRRTNPYGDGHAAERIVAALEHLLDGRRPPAPFGAGFDRPRRARRRRLRRLARRLTDARSPHDSSSRAPPERSARPARSVVIPFDGLPLAGQLAPDRGVRRDRRDARSGRSRSSCAGSARSHGAARRAARRRRRASRGSSSCRRSTRRSRSRDSVERLLAIDARAAARSS